MDDDWQRRITEVWDRADELAPDELVAAIDELAAERPDDPVATFEAAGARDSTGLEAEAEILYRRAIDDGLGEPYLGQATIQLASTIRNLGRADESVRMLVDFYGARPDHELAAAASAFLALALHDIGRTTEAVAVAVGALAPTLPRYTRSVAAYAAELGQR